MKIETKETYVASCTLLNSFPLWLAMLLSSFLKLFLWHFLLSVHLTHLVANIHALTLVPNSASEKFDMYDVKQINNAYEQAVYNTTEKIQFEAAYEQSWKGI